MCEIDVICSIITAMLSTVTNKIRSLPFYHRLMRTPSLVLTGWWSFLIQSDHSYSDPMKRYLHHWSDTRNDDCHKQPGQPVNGQNKSYIIFSVLFSLPFDPGDYSEL